MISNRMFREVFSELNFPVKYFVKSYLCHDIYFHISTAAHTREQIKKKIHYTNAILSNETWKLVDGGCWCLRGKLKTPFCAYFPLRFTRHKTSEPILFHLHNAKFYPDWKVIGNSLLEFCGNCVWWCLLYVVRCCQLPDGFFLRWRVCINEWVVQRSFLFSIFQSDTNFN